MKSTSSQILRSITIGGILGVTVGGLIEAWNAPFLIVMLGLSIIGFIVLKRKIALPLIVLGLVSVLFGWSIYDSHISKTPVVNEGYSVRQREYLQRVF